MTEILSEWVHHVLVWIGFGTVVGLLSKAVLPGKDPGGTFATLFIGIFGSFIGAATLFFFTGEKVSPISMIGLLVGIVGAALLLLTYRILHGHAFPMGFVSVFKPRRDAGGRRRRVVVEE